MGLFDKLLKKEKKNEGCCSFNLDAEIEKANKEEKKSSCCDFNLDAEIEKAKEEETGCDCGGKC